MAQSQAPRVGMEIPQVSAVEKVSGRAIYAGDIQFQGMLHAKVLRSPYPHARIVKIDTSAAAQLPGVKAVLTGADTPEGCWGVPRKEHRVLAVGKVRFVGEEVAVVVAVDEHTAQSAVDLIRVEYEELPALTCCEDALAEGAPEIHEGTANRSKEVHIVRGDVDAAFERAAVIHEAVYDVPSQYQGYLEPMATVAWAGGDGRLTVWTSTQSVFMARTRMADALNRPVSSIRVIQATTGGGFGAKIVEECNSVIAAFAATKVSRPVRLVNSRLEDFLGCRMAVPERIWLKMGVDTNGKIVAKDVRITAECGAYAGLSPHIMVVSAQRSDNMHRLENVRTHAQTVYTNNPPRGALRGFGGQQINFAVNSHLAVLAEKLGMDLREIHRSNAIRKGDTSVHGWTFGSAGYIECLDQVCEAIDWENRDRARLRGGERKRGFGIAPAVHVSGNRQLGNWDGSTVTLKINEDGRALVRSGECDAGQGSATMFAQLCAIELGIPVDHITVMAPDTDSAPYAIGSIASRVTINGGNAMIRAARQAKDQLLQAAAQKLEVDIADLEWKEGRIHVREKVDGSLSISEAVACHIYRHGGSGVEVQATYDPPTVMMNKDHYGNVAPGYSFSAWGVQVEVDTETGQVELMQVVVSDDCGKALNPLTLHGQSAGAAAQSIGWALYENLQYEDGRLMNGNFADYTMPTAHSLPRIECGLIESNEPNGPYGAKGGSETVIIPGAAAIAQAVYDAIGVRFTTLPITPEAVLEALDRKNKGTGHACV
ncbi:xanthine dehydrogenase family protein molybdopterin-binding subunit [Pusillimonas noertemannii]|uniref:CO/xanthine dehydrogenase Mo-binding subunit n=1 Tax=Pusillimonas noertemannii TaxID=305977 RepID=A0A2U1CPL4_9BURK|nr:xanthine dehydrogenase family protein molybdopterin-binding subunit [Pusillimonas noertemannii]NYT67150.1 xanthine dehydrogenase family protein molybdopterin-binding subunit [Pusillimonas noertemannii]PVY67825.1 CO/xanthine dehydrogenase Mo-binding subunit [Pusillimonas noertemannii]TFL12924.1 xanthine dehydrogenase family protein molybdopterin-binding subunit [Pusillimonas noertemannii]